MDDRFPVSVLHPFAYARKQFQSLPQRELVPIAVFRDREPRNVLHHEVRTPLRSGTRIEHLGDRRMIHEG